MHKIGQVGIHPMQNDSHTTPEKANLKRKEYEEKLRQLQIELCQLQEWVRQEGLRIIVIFEGRDAAGKGGAIKAITERVSPRVFRGAIGSRENADLFAALHAAFPGGGRDSDLRSQLV
jgi:polyphosphate kinase 2 (PPK2 family)